MISNTDPLYSDRMIKPKLCEAEKTVQPVVQEPLAEIVFDDLRPADQLLIHTNNSIYRFTVIDPMVPLGQLTGGPLDDYPEEAILLPMPEYKKISSSDFKRLKTGWRASFIIKSSVGSRRLITSPIGRIAHIKIADEIERL